MRALTLHLPKWFWLLVVLGVFVGQTHQLMCMAGGDHATPATHADVVLGSDADGGAGPDGPEGACPFDCQSHVSVPCVLAPYVAPAPTLLGMTGLGLPPAGVPTSRCESIDYPPQLV